MLGPVSSRMPRAPFKQFRKGGCCSVWGVGVVKLAEDATPVGAAGAAGAGAAPAGAASACPEVGAAGAGAGAPPKGAAATGRRRKSGGAAEEPGPGAASGAEAWARGRKYSGSGSVR